jgi:hypothetical protein
MARSLVAIGATGSHVNATQFENQLRDVIESLQPLTLDNEFNYGGNCTAIMHVFI